MALTTSGALIRDGSEWDLVPTTTTTTTTTKPTTTPTTTPPFSTTELLSA